MKRVWIVAVAAAVAGANACHAQEAADKAKAATFDARMFAGPAGHSPGQKSYACFVRRYDASQLSQHPKQKVSAMKLLVTAEYAPEDKITNYSFRLGFKYRHRPGNFDSNRYCNQVAAEINADEIRLGCGVDCDGGGIDVAMANDDKFALIRLERIRIWERNKADDDASNDLTPGAELQSLGYLYLRPRWRAHCRHKLARYLRIPRIRPPRDRTGAEGVILVNTHIPPLGPPRVLTIRPRPRKLSGTRKSID